MFGHSDPTELKAPMTSATGNPQRSRSGFTILEIVLVLGLIAVGSSIVITNFSSIASRGDQLTTEEALRAAIRNARFIAASQREDVRLSFDKDQGALVSSDGSRFQLAADFGTTGRGEILFYLVPPASGLSPFPAPDKTTLKTDEVIFCSDRSSSSFVVEIDIGFGSPIRQVYDPFSSLKRTVK